MKNYRFDYVLLVIFLLLVFLGFIFLASASGASSYAITGKPYYFLLRHVLFGILPGIFLGILAYNIKISFYKKWAWFIFLIGIFSLLLIFVPGFGITSGGATRWLNFYFFSIQPSEFFKIACILYLGSWFSNRSYSKKNKEKQRILPFLFVIAFIAIIFRYQPDISTFGVILASSLMIYYFSNFPFWHFLLVFLLVCIIFSVFVFLSEYRLERIRLFLGIIDDPMGLGFQSKQSFLIIGSGGIFGQGLGTFSENPAFLPQPIGDSIFSVIAKESGFIGSTLVIILFFAFFWRGIRIGMKSKDEFSLLVAVGISSWIYIQSMVNIGAMIGIIPITGIPLPFISYGGSHIIAEFIGVSLLLNISKSS